ncbi:hypothetical protein PIB30_032092 [Stylosanthes scabra]|uniref:Dof-type domain-containing protein n=1 Tax=Stylosanthes scabra TaxID=79078 RepID=A0ABU6TC95_9FABA|nr:hypothetical protein [Stylosanthes scabra]
MVDNKDPAITLFGKKIPFPGAGAQEQEHDADVVTELEDGEEKHKDGGPADEVSEKKKEGDPPPNASKDSGPKTPSIEEESGKQKKEEKALKKPDKVLPCQRCNSMDTKFCYYNNYNVNQPRYFCKACQRYWTAGGTMRNVPVGSGRRKNKNTTSSHYSHITISEALQAANTNSRVLSFGLDTPPNPICDSMASVLEPCKSGENGGDDCSSASSITVSNSMEETVGKTASQEEPLPQTNGFIPPQVPCIPNVAWPYPPWNSAVPSSPAALCPPGFPISFYPAPFWNWNVPWFPSHPSTPNQNSWHSPTLGKHSRDDDDPPRHRNGCVLVPKTLRIDDPSEAAKSSIWATLGIKNERVSFKAFQSKKEEKNKVVETSPVLLANPAALCRSLNFHENS